MVATLNHWLVKMKVFVYPMGFVNVNMDSLIRHVLIVCVIFKQVLRNFETKTSLWLKFWHFKTHRLPATPRTDGRTEYPNLIPLL